LGLAARLGQRRREVSEQHRQEQPDVQRQQVGDRRLALVAQGDGDGVCKGQDGTDLDHEHDRVLPLDVRPEHDERLPEGGLHQIGSEQTLAPAGAPRQLGLDGFHVGLGWFC